MSTPIIYWRMHEFDGHRRRRGLKKIRGKRRKYRNYNRAMNGLARIAWGVVRDSGVKAELWTRREMA